MCLAVPARVVRISGNKALVDFGGIEREVKVDLVDASMGDYVIVHAGFAISVLSEDDAEESLKHWRNVLRLQER